MIVETVKAAVFIFPFIKELFLGKDKNKKTEGAKDPKDAKPPEIPGKTRFLRQVLITVAILSVIVNIALIEKLFVMASSMVSLKREVSSQRQEAMNPRRLPDDTAPLPPLVDPSVVKPVEPTSPPVPLPERQVQQPVLPPREEHLKPPSRPARGSGRHQDTVVVDRTEALHRRLRSIDDIK